MNLITKTDSYKSSHYLQIPPNVEYMSSYIEPRKNNFGFEIEGIVHFGMQTFLNKYFSKPITMNDVYEAGYAYLKPHGEPFNLDGWKYIINEYAGFLPLFVESLPEGTVVPIGTPVVQVVNTDPKLPWLTSYFETIMLRGIWYPSTVATLSREIKRVIYTYLSVTSDDPIGQLPFKLHDFGARGVSSGESAQLGGLAHLVNFMGTDNVEAIVAARKYYHEYDGVVGYSIPASEHSTITVWGEENETAAYENMITQFSKPGSLYACVSDSYDIYNAVSNIWGGTLKDKVMSSGGTLVIRPDSGIPEIVVLKVLTLLEEKFPVTTNSKGYKVLPPYLRVIQGDGVNFHSICNILGILAQNGWSTENVAFGMGGALLQQVNRDTLGYAMKTNAKKIKDDYEWLPVSKNPKTDPGKKSKPGRIHNHNLVTAFRGGNILVCDELSTIRKRAEIIY